MGYLSGHFNLNRSLPESRFNLLSRYRNHNIYRITEVIYVIQIPIRSKNRGSMVINQIDKPYIGKWPLPLLIDQRHPLYNALINECGLRNFVKKIFISWICQLLIRYKISQINILISTGWTEHWTSIFHMGMEARRGGSL